MLKKLTMQNYFGRISQEIPSITFSLDFSCFSNPQVTLEINSLRMQCERLKNFCLRFPKFEECLESLIHRRQKTQMQAAVEVSDQSH